MCKVRVLNTCSYFTWCGKGIGPAKDGNICISDLIALKVTRIKPQFFVPSNVLAENENDFHILAFPHADEFRYKQAKEYDN